VRFAPAQMVVDVLTEERDGVKKERDGEEGRFARLVTSLIETLHIDLGDFNGRWSPRIRTASNPRPFSELSSTFPSHSL
jgi:hypothetical protein